MEAACYIVFLSQKSQAEAVEIIYNKDSSEVNTTTVATAIKNLHQRGAIIINISGGAKSPIYKSNVEYFINYLKNELTDTKSRSHNPSRYDLSEDDINFLRKFLDSDWFRETFFSKQALQLIENANMDFERRINQRRVYAERGIFAIANILTRMLAVTEAFDLEPLKHYTPSSKDIKDFKTFDEFAVNWSQKLPARTIEKFRIKCKKYLGSDYSSYITESGLKNPYYVLCIPLKLLVIRNICHNWSTRITADTAVQEAFGISYDWKNNKLKTKKLIN